jgi:hypothetical protein
LNDHIGIRRGVLLAVAVMLAACGSDRVAPVVYAELVIVTDSLPTARQGVAYHESVHAAGGDSAYTWQVASGQLPPGIALTVDDLGELDQAILTGIPEEAGLFTFALSVRSGDGQVATRAFHLRVEPELPLGIETVAVPPALAGAPYDIQLRAHGGDERYEWALVEGRLPNGLTLTPQGRIQGSPAAPDTARFTAEVRSARQVLRKEYVLAVVPHRTGTYNITLFPVSPVPAGVAPHLEAAVAEWEAILVDDLPAIQIPTDFFAASHCGGFGRLVNGTTTDDILIIIDIAPIDGPGGVLGRAGPCGLRGGTVGRDLPFAGVVTLDLDDLERFVGSDFLTFIISHEIAHVLGFGTIWQRVNLLEGAGGQDPRFVGPRAVTEFQRIGGAGMVPVENTGGQGTRDGHWRQNVFGAERMTGFAAPPGTFQPLSAVSLASFIDLGYNVDLSKADSFTLSAALMQIGPDGRHWHDIGHDEILREPIRILHPDGRTDTFVPR